MKYSILHNSFIADENDSDDKRMIRDGERLRVPLTMMDSVQQAVADMDASDYDKVHVIDRQKMIDWAKAELSARWKGGLQDGDRVRIGDKTRVVAGRDPDNGKVQLRDTSTTDAETIKQQAYDQYSHDISTAWMRTNDAESGDACTINGEAGRWRKDKDGKLVCRPTKSASPPIMNGPWRVRLAMRSGSMRRIECMRSTTATSKMLGGNERDPNLMAWVPFLRFATLR